LLKKFGPFLALFVQIRPKFGRRIVRPLHFLFGPFLTYAAEQSASWQHCTDLIRGAIIHDAAPGVTRIPLLPPTQLLHITRLHPGRLHQRSGGGGARSARPCYGRPTVRAGGSTSPLTVGDGRTMIAVVMTVCTVCRRRWDPEGLTHLTGCVSGAVFKGAHLYNRARYRCTSVQ
jgi:hypothetical protein